MILKNLNIVGEDTGAKDVEIQNDVIFRITSSDNSNKDEEQLSINFEDCIAFPGLVNSHDHLEFNLYPQLGHKIYEDYVEWGNDIHEKDKEVIESIESIPVELRLRYGVIKNLLNGVTSVAHHGAYHSCLDDSPVSIIKNTSIHSVKLGGRWKLKLNWVKNSEPYVIHIGEGINPQSFEEINELIRYNFFKRKLIGIHGIAMNEEQSKNFEALVWCPVSNLFLFNKTADINSIKKNTKILFGTDSTLTSDPDIWEHLRKARELNLLTDEELFSSLTNEAAEIWDLKNKGKILDGYSADIVIAKRKSGNLFDSFYMTNPEDIILIIKDGEIILFDNSILNQISSLQIKVKLKDFDEVNVNGRIKFVKYRVNEILEKIKGYGYRSSLIGIR
jgi:cytosine/adenosine deaminase-related metal-dependent hydrolase